MGTLADTLQKRRAEWYRLEKLTDQLGTGSLKGVAGAQIAELSELSGGTVRLVGSKSAIRLDGLESENPRGECVLVAEDVPKCPEDDLTFQVNGRIWQQLPLGAQ